MGLSDSTGVVPSKRQPGIGKVRYHIIYQTIPGNYVINHMSVNFLSLLKTYNTKEQALIYILNDIIIFS